MEGIISFITSNWVEIGSVFLMLVGAFSIIAKWTPNTVDNKIADFLLKIVNFLGFKK